MFSCSKGWRLPTDQPSVYSFKMLYRWMMAVWGADPDRFKQQYYFIKLCDLILRWCSKRTAPKERENQMSLMSTFEFAHGYQLRCWKNSVCFKKRKGIFHINTAWVWFVLQVRLYRLLVLSTATFFIKHWFRVCMGAGKEVKFHSKNLSVSVSCIAWRPVDCYPEHRCSHSLIF